MHHYLMKARALNTISSTMTRPCATTNAMLLQVDCLLAMDLAWCCTIRVPSEQQPLESTKYSKHFFHTMHPTSPTQAHASVTLPRQLD